MGTQTQVKVGGVWKPSIKLDWVNIPAADIINGFATQVGNPIQRARVDMAGGKYEFWKGTLILPNPLPTANTIAVQNLPASAFNQYQYQPLGPATGWGGEGKRTYWMRQTTALFWIFVSGSTQVVGEVVDMASIGAIRLG